MGVSLSFKAYSGKESSEFQKHYKSVKFCIENELSFPIETLKEKLTVVIQMIMKENIYWR